MSINLNPSYNFLLQAETVHETRLLVITCTSRYANIWQVAQTAQTAQRHAQHPAQPPLVSVKTIDPYGRREVEIHIHGKFMAFKNVGVRKAGLQFNFTSV